MSLGRQINLNKLLVSCRHLTAAQLGAVLRMAEYAVLNECLPTAPAQLCRIVGIPSNKWNENMHQAYTLCLQHQGFVVRGRFVHPESGSTLYTPSQGAESTPREKAVIHGNSVEYANNSANNLAEPRAGVNKLIYIHINDINKAVPKNGQKPIAPPEPLATDLQELLLVNIRRQVDAIAKQYGVLPEQLETVVADFTKFHQETAFVDARHVANAFRIHCKNLFAQSSKKSEPRGGDTAPKPRRLRSVREQIPLETQKKSEP